MGRALAITAAVILLIAVGYLIYPREDGNQVALHSVEALQASNWRDLYDRVDDNTRQVNGWTEATFTAFASTLTRGLEDWKVTTKIRQDPPPPPGSISMQSFDPNNEAWLDVTFHSKEASKPITRTVIARKDPTGKWRADIIELLIARNYASLNSRERLERMLEAMKAANMTKLVMPARKVTTTPERISQVLAGELPPGKVFLRG